MGLKFPEVDDRLRQRRHKATFVVQEEKTYKLCTGITHPEGAWVPIENFYVHKKGELKGKPLYKCKECFARYSHDPDDTLVRVTPYRFIIVELVNRLGIYETARRIGVSPDLIRLYLKGMQETTRRRYIKRAIVVLRELRENNESRHRESIKRGSYLRGQAEKIPKKSNEYYNYTDEGRKEVERLRARKRRRDEGNNKCLNK